MCQVFAKHCQGGGPWGIIHCGNRMFSTIYFCLCICIWVLSFLFVNCICVFGFVYLAVCAPSEKLSAVEIEFSEHGQAQLPVSQMISLNGIWKQLNWRRFILDLVRQSHISKQQVDYFTEIRCNSFHKIQYQYQKLLLCSKMEITLILGSQTRIALLLGWILVINFFTF